MRVHFRVTSVWLAVVLILIGITRGWALIPMIGLCVLAIGVFILWAVIYGISHPTETFNYMVEDHKRVHSDFLVVNANTKEIIRRYRNFYEAKDDIILWGRTIKNGYDFDGKTVFYDAYFKHNGFKENGYGYAHYDIILYKEYDYYKEMNNND